MLFNRYKKAKVVYSFDRTYSFPTSIFSNPYLYNKNNYGCPSIQITNNRLYAINAPLDIKITYNSLTDTIDTQTTSSNTVSGLGVDVFNYINVNKNIMNNNIAIQCMLPYIFFTDTKDIEISVLPGTDLQMINCTFLPGSFNIYSWNRMLNFAIEITDKNKEASFEWNVDKPFMFIYFNKPINLEYKLMTDKMWAMCAEVRDVTKLRNNITKIYKTVLSRRPKKLL